MKNLVTFIPTILGLMLIAVISVDWSNTSTKHPEPVLNKWDYKLTKIKEFKSTYGSALYQGNSGECYLRVNHYSTSGLTVVNCSDFMEIGNEQ